MSVYRVTGRLAYRGYQPDETFEATLDREAETRAINRRAISRVEVSTPSLQPGSYRLPDGWVNPHDNQEV